MIKEVAQMLINLFPEKKLNITYEIPREMGIGYSKIGRTVLNLKKLENLGWDANIGLKTGLKRTVLSFDMNGKKI